MAKGIKSIKGIEVGDNLYAKRDTVVYLQIPSNTDTISRDVIKGEHLGVVKKLVKEFEDDAFPSYIEVEDQYDTFYAIYDNVLFEGVANPDYLYPDSNNSLPQGGGNKTFETVKAIFDYVSSGLGIFRRKGGDTSNQEVERKKTSDISQDENPPTFWSRYGLYLIIVIALSVIIAGISILRRKKKTAQITTIQSV